VGFKQFLRVRGVGYKFQLLGDKMTIQAGYSHLLEVRIPFLQSFSFNKKSTFLRVKSNNLVLLTKFLSFVRNLRKPDVYKGKGIRYKRDSVLRKEGKKKKSA
jgi:large subunit ribosomal protein L6